MYNLRENAMAIYNGEQPDFYGDFMDVVSICPDPIFLSDVVPVDGQRHKDSWGVWKQQAPSEPGATPINSNVEDRVIKDILDWRDSIEVPDISNLDWSLAESFVEGVNRAERFVCFFSAAGLFERCHFLMGMEDAMCNFLEEPEEIIDLLTVIKDYKIEAIHQATKHLHPDVIFYQDDWGSKQNLFLPPDVWRETIKPLQQEISDAIHECGMIYIHHSDCYNAPITRDMVEIGIDIWQGAIPENPIPEIQKDTRENCDHQLRMIGGVDVPACDFVGEPEEKIRQIVRENFDRCLPGGYMFMGTSGGPAFNEPNNTWMSDEMLRYGRQWALEHPIGPIPNDDVTIDGLAAMFEKKVILPSDNA